MLSTGIIVGSRSPSDAADLLPGTTQFPWWLKSARLLVQPDSSSAIVEPGAAGPTAALDASAAADESRTGLAAAVAAIGAVRPVLQSPAGRIAQGTGEVLL